MSFTERRRHERVIVEIHVNWGWTEECPYSDRIISLSVGGYFLRTSRSSAYKGRTVFLRFWLPEERLLRGEVRYHLEKMGLGVEFKGITDEETRKLEALVEHYRNSPQT
jgi:hypothetical protein